MHVVYAHGSLAAHIEDKKVFFGTKII